MTFKIFGIRATIREAHQERGDRRKWVAGSAIDERLPELQLAQRDFAAKARSSLFQGKVYYFCSADCREKFEASPASFLGKTPTPMEHRHG